MVIVTFFFTSVITKNKGFVGAMFFRQRSQTGFANKPYTLQEEDQ